MTDDTLIKAWADFVWEVGHTPELIVAGVQRIHRDVGLTLKPEVLFDGSLTLEKAGYTQNKLSALQRNYFNEASVERARSDLAWRIEHKKYGSGAFDFRGTPKKNTKQDYCFQSCVISYYPQKKATTIHVFWRTAELIKRWRGDLLFLRDFILPHFEAELAAAPPMQIDFRFANVTFHPMYTVLLVQYSEWRKHFERLRVENYHCFRSCMYWAWRYLCDTSQSIDSYSSARQVRVIANRVTDPAKLGLFKKYVEGKIVNHMDDYPDSVQGFYTKRSARPRIK